MMIGAKQGVKMPEQDKDLEQNLDQLPDIFENEISDTDLPGADDFIVEVESAEALSVFTDEEFNAEFLRISQQYVGVSRSSNLAQVAKFLALFNLPAKMGEKWVPYCASGASYAAAKAYCNLAGIQYNADNSVAIFKTVLSKLRDRFFTPSPSCWAMQEGAKKKGNWVPKTPDNMKLIKPGWLVLYNFDGKTMPKHVGIVLFVASDHIKTVEFNTSSTDNINGGAVSYRTRKFSPILGFIKTI